MRGLSGTSECSALSSSAAMTDDTRAVIVVVRQVPAQVCDRCGTTTVTDEVAEELARIADAQQGNAVSGTVVVDVDQRQIAAAG